MLNSLLNPMVKSSFSTEYDAKILKKFLPSNLTSHTFPPSDKSFNIENKVLKDLTQKYKLLTKDDPSSDESLKNLKNESKKSKKDIKIKKPNAVYTVKKEKIKLKKIPKKRKISSSDSEKEEEISLRTFPNYIQLFDDAQVEEKEFSFEGEILIEETKSSDTYLSLLKKELLDDVSASLLTSSNLHSKEDPTYLKVSSLVQRIASIDPEFILKLALYSRKHLSLRSISNLLLSLASCHPQAKSFLSKYFAKSVNLPSDWLEVVQFTLSMRNSLPPVLRKVLSSKFSDFDAYQLAKYNREKSTKKKKKKMPEGSVGQLLTLKQLIRLLHINKPVDHVMCLLGKKYPSTHDEFFKLKLEGLFEEERAGTRMKLPLPLTWETQLSSESNKTKVWMNLIDQKKLPFMAMLRNLRNMVLARMYNSYYEYVVKKLTDKTSVINSKQFPFRFYSAYAALEQLQKDKYEARQKISLKKRNRNKRQMTLLSLNMGIIDSLKEALETSVKISINHNIPPIEGRSVIVCDFSNSDVLNQVCETSKSLGNSKNVGMMMCLLSLMCRHASEDCLMIAMGTKRMNHVVVNNKNSLLQNVNKVLDLIKVVNEEEKSKKVEEFGYVDLLFNELISQGRLINNFIFFNNSSEGLLKKKLTHWLLRYKKLIYNHIHLYDISLLGKKPSVVQGAENLWIQIQGFSDQVLRYISQNGDASQLKFIENIDKMYGLEESRHMKKLKQKLKSPILSSPSSLLSTSKLPKWVNCRVFISSTFLDMFSERDLLVRFVFEELKLRCQKHHINLFEVDLRWGISEEQVHNALELCLTEVQKSDFFLGILGERYGQAQENYESVGSLEGMSWLKNHKKGCSITELEILQCLRKPHFKDRAFFYFRDPSFIKDVPKKYMSLVTDDKEEKLRTLKKTIKNSGAEVFDNYPCKWGGISENKEPIITNLEEFGQRVLSNLWNGITNLFPHHVLLFQEDNGKQEEEEVDKLKELNESFVDCLTQRFLGRKKMLFEFKQTLINQKNGIVILSGKPGSGKSSLMASTLKGMRDENSNLNDYKIIFYSTSSFTPNSSSFSSTSDQGDVQMIKYLLRQMVHDSSFVPPDDLKNLCLQMHQQLSTTFESFKKLYLFLDGFDSSYSSFSWIPDNLANNIVLVISGNNGSECLNTLKERGRGRSREFSLVEIKNLEVEDKQMIVRRKLETYSKRLEESILNNQLRQITNRKESYSPLYLTLVCDQLRKYGDFNNLSKLILSLPPTIPKLLEHLLENLESFYGYRFTMVTMLLLYFSKNGLSESELMVLLTTALSIPDLEKLEKLEDWFSNEMSGFVPHQSEEKESLILVTPNRLLSFIFSIQQLIKPYTLKGQKIDTTISLAHSLVTEVVKKKYLNKKKLENNFHLLLAAYYDKMADPLRNKSWMSSNAIHFSRLFYHLKEGKCFEQLSQLLTSLSFLRKCFVLQLSNDLIHLFSFSEDLESAHKRSISTFFSCKKFQDFKSFVVKHSHVLSLHPHLVMQQAMLEKENSEVYQEANLYLMERPEEKYFDLLNKKDFSDFCVHTIENVKQTPTCLALSPDCILLAAAFDDLTIKIFDSTSFKVQSTLIGHSNEITCLKFISLNRLFSCSKDCSISMWDVKGGFRINRLESHSRSVTSCVADKVGRFFISGGLDGLLLLWHAITGRLEKTITRDKSPINCVSLHPEEHIVAIGCWDGTLKLFELISCAKKSVIWTKSGSVRDLAFSSDGHFISSAHIEGGVKIWSSNFGCLIGEMKSHSLPINCLNFSSSQSSLVTASDDGLIKISSSSPGFLLSDFTDSTLKNSTCISFNPLSSSSTLLVAVGYHSRFVQMYSCLPEEKLWEKMVPGNSSVTCLCFRVTKKDGVGQPEATQLVVGLQDGSIFTLRLDDGAVNYQLQGHCDKITSIVCTEVAPSSSSSSPFFPLIISSCQDGSISVYSSVPDDSHKTLTHNRFSPTYQLFGHVSCVTSLALSPSQQRLASVGHDRNLVIWKIGLEGIKEKEVNHAHSDWITCCSWGEEDFLATGSNDFNIKIWNLKTMIEKTRLTGHLSPITSLKYKLGCLVSSSVDGWMKVWSHKGVLITSIKAHLSRCNAIDFHVNLTGDETIPRDEKPKNSSDRFEDLKWETNKMTDKSEDFVEEDEEENENEDGDDNEEENREKEEVGKKIKISKENLKMRSLYAASVGDDGEFKVWVPLMTYEKHSLIGHSSSVLSLALAKNNQFWSSSNDQTIKLWKVAKETEGCEQGQNPTCSSINPDNNLICSGTREGNLVIGFFSRSSSLFQLTTKKVTDHVICAISFVDNNLLAVATSNYDVIVFKITQKNEIVSIESIFTNKTNHMTNQLISIKNSESTFNLFSSSLSGSIELFSLESSSFTRNSLTFKLLDGKEELKCLVGLYVSGSFSSKSKVKRNREEEKGDEESFLLVAGSNTLLYSLNMLKPTNPVILSTTHWTNKVIKSEDLIYAGDFEGYLMIFDTKNIMNNQLNHSKMMKAHKSKITCLVAHGNCLFTSSFDSTIKVWQLPELKQIGYLETFSPIIFMETYCGFRNIINIFGCTKSGVPLQLSWVDKS